MAVAAGCAAGAVLLATAERGIGLLADSAVYISAAQNLVAGRGLTAYDGYPLVSWPPLYSLLIAGPAALGVDPVLAARLLNALAAGLAVGLAGLLFLRVLRSRLLATIGTVALVAPPLLWLAAQALAETVFFALILGTTVALISFLESPRASRFALACCLVALLPLQRYIGAVFAPAAAVATLALAAGRWRTRLLGTAGFLVFGLLPCCVWLWRNHHLTGSWAGFGRAGLSIPLAANLRTIGTGLPGFLVTPQSARAGEAVALAVLLALVVVQVVRDRQRPSPARRAFWVGLIGVGAYVVGLACVLTPDIYNQIYRFLAPIHPVMLLIALGGWDELGSIGAGRTGRGWIRPVAAMVFATWLTIPALHTAAVFRNWSGTGAGQYNHESWRRSAMLAWLREYATDRLVLSNDPAGVYLISRVPAKMSPRPAWGINRSQIPPGTLLVWFEGVRRPYLYQEEELVSSLNLAQVRSFPEGIIYVVR